eukprot:SAG11_NODE_44_length_20765_cov_5.183635_8_plen_76_part_00
MRKTSIATKSRSCSRCVSTARDNLFDETLPWLISDSHSPNYHFSLSRETYRSLGLCHSLPMTRLGHSTISLAMAE